MERGKEIGFRLKWQRFGRGYPIYAIPLFVLSGLLSQYCASATQATVTPTTAGVTRQFSTTPHVENPTADTIARFEASASNNVHAVDREQSSAVSTRYQNRSGNVEQQLPLSLSGRPDYSLFGYNLGMERGTEALSASDPYLFRLEDTRQIPAYSVSGRPDHILYGLEADSAQHNPAINGAKLHQHNFADTDRLPVYSLSGRPDYTLYGLQ